MGETGDLLIRVTVREHPYFKREGSDVYTDKYITMTQAILGGTVKVETLYGKTNLKIKPGTVHDEQVKLEGMGVSKLPPNQNVKGTHYVKVKIAIPKKLNDIQRQALENYAKVEDKIAD